MASDPTYILGAEAIITGSCYEIAALPFLMSMRFVPAIARSGTGTRA